MGHPGARFEPSHRMGDFVLRRWLAQGGMAELYLASPVDPRRGHELVVLKRVLPQFTRSESFTRMFDREARLASMLHHPNIVAVHEGGGGGGQDCFFTMEYVHGVDLGVLLDVIRDRGGALPLAHALTIVVSICAGLHYAHEARGPDGTPLQIVHRDVSPSNVLVSFDGEVKVTDFGVATALAMTRLTEEGTRKGKLSYMSPEQATGETVDRRADVFAIATVLYELTTMQRLFAGENDLAIMYNILHRPRPSPRELSPGYPAALEEIVMRAVSHDASERFATALELQRALEGFAASVGLPLSVEALGRFVRSTVPVPMHPREDPELWATSMQPRSGPHHVVTAIDDSRPRSQPDAGVPTGPIPGLVPTGPTGAIPIAAVSAHSGRHVLGPGAGPSASWVAAPQPSSNGLRWLSIGLAGVAAVVAGVVAIMVWRVDEAPLELGEPHIAPAVVESGEPAAVEPAAIEAAETPQPSSTQADPRPSEADASAPAPVADEPSPLPSSSRKAKKKRRKRPAATTEPEPASPEPSKKPSPTDTLLPIRE